MLVGKEPEYVRELPDGTIKQLNPFTGTEVWTVPGRGNRPLGITAPNPEPLAPADHGKHCAFCESRYLETPPEKSRLVCVDGQWETHTALPAGELCDTTAEFRRIPNLFEILSFDYWHANYGFELPEHIADRRATYFTDPASCEHVMTICRTKLRASGHSPEQVESLTPELAMLVAASFFGGSHDVIVARRHFVAGATDSSQLASSGTLSVEEHRHYIQFSVDALESLYRNNSYARYVAVFQNWLKPAGASFDHLHKQLAAIDERGPRNEASLPKLRVNPNLFNEATANYAMYHNLVIAENDHALAFAGFGHRYPTIEIYSKSECSDPWEQTAEEVAAMSDLLHAMHAATGPEVPCNEEWHHRPVDVPTPMPWRIMLKWRISTLAGFEGGTQVYLNTISPQSMKERVEPQLFALREEGKIADIRIGPECRLRPNPLKYCR